MPELMEHQVEGIDWLRDRPRALLADEPGLGKTAQLLLSAKEPILAVAPAMVLDSGTWDDEIEKWAPGADVTQVSYSSLTEREKTSKGGTRPTDRLKPEYRGHYGTVIGDESHYIKNRKTHWSVAFQKLRADNVRLATGTPIPNWAHEAFTSLQVMYPEEAKPGRDLGSYWRWAKNWFEVGPTHWSPMDVGDLREDRTWEQFRQENWGDRMLLRLREDVLKDLPPLTLQQWRVPMTKEQARVYRQLKKDFIAWLASGEEIVAWNSASQLVKLAKAATGLQVLDPTVDQSGKLDTLQRILSDRPLPTLVVAHFRDSVEACARAARVAGQEAFWVHGGTPRQQRRDFIRAFQRGNLQVLCASIDLISEGMTMVAGDQVVRVERSWRPHKNEQVLRRLHRIGQTRPVTAIDLVSADTVDESILDLLTSKTEQQIRALGIKELRALAA